MILKRRHSPRTSRSQFEQPAFQISCPPCHKTWQVGLEGLSGKTFRDRIQLLYLIQRQMAVTPQAEVSYL